MVKLWGRWIWLAVSWLPYSTFHLSNCQNLLRFETCKLEFNFLYCQNVLTAHFLLVVDAEAASQSKLPGKQTTEAPLWGALLIVAACNRTQLLRAVQFVLPECVFIYSRASIGSVVIWVNISFQPDEEQKGAHLLSGQAPSWLTSSSLDKRLLQLSRHVRVTRASIVPKTYDSSSENTPYRAVLIWPEPAYFSLSHCLAVLLLWTHSEHHKDSC